MRLIVSTRARRYVLAAWVYLAEESGSIQVANRFRDSIQKAYIALQANPLLGRSRVDDLKQDARTLTVGKYLILYRIDAGEMTIVRVLHGSRDLATVLSPEI